MPERPRAHKGRRRRWRSGHPCRSAQLQFPGVWRMLQGGSWASSSLAAEIQAALASPTAAMLHACGSRSNSVSPCLRTCATHACVLHQTTRLRHRLGSTHLARASAVCVSLLREPYKLGLHDYSRNKYIWCYCWRTYSYMVAKRA